jgi:cytochrome c peroxidase
MKLSLQLLLLGALVSTQAEAVLLIQPTPLNTAVIEPKTITINGSTPALISAIIKDNKAAIQLGKALFWDAAIGSDGMACASCHFQAGADSRTINQTNPGFNHGSLVFDALPSGNVGPNAQLHTTDFPLFQFGAIDPLNPLRLTASVVDDSISSAGTQNGTYVSTDLAGVETCTSRVADTSFKDGLNVRRVEPRNTPTIINSTLSVRNFWDGRGNRVFNGVNPFGLRDTTSKIWANVIPNIVPTPAKIVVNNASLASQAVGPVLSDLEMSCHLRTFADVGKKMVNRTLLEGQKVATTDSVLGHLVKPSFYTTSSIKNTVTYKTLIEQAFQPPYWTGNTPTGQPIEEANFALFFGLAVQAYGETLISDQSKYDRLPRTVQPFTPAGAVTPIATAPQLVRNPNGAFKGLSLSESRGFDLFMGAVSPLNPATGIDPATGLPVPAKNGRCILCHNGPEFTSAAFTALAPAPLGVTLLVPPAAAPVEFLAEPMPFLAALPGAPIPPDVAIPVFNPALDFGTYDLGFYDIGVTPLAYDHGLGGNDPFGNPLAFAQQWQNAFTAGNPCVVAPFVLGQLTPNTGAACAPPATADIFNVNVNFTNLAGTPIVLTPLDAPARTDGSFKTPSLRNVELTAPYFHNGSAKSIPEALLVYNNGGLFINPNHHPEIIPLGLVAQDFTDITNFLLTLTDNRVKFERAPFDHPSLPVPNGQKVVNGLLVTKTGTTEAVDNILQIPAVGRAGRLIPPASFASKLAP